MMTFLAVTLGIVTANIIMTVVIFALYASKRVRKWLFKKFAEYNKECIGLIEETFEEL